MKTENNINISFSSPLTVAAVLGVAFIILKLCGVIAWSWSWVLAPFWIPMALVLLVLAGVILIPLACIAAVGLFSIVKSLFKK